MAVCLCFIGNASAQWVVSDPGNLAQGIINTTKQIVQTSTTAKNTLDGFMEAQKIFQQGKVYYDALKAVHDVVKGGIKVKKSIELVAEISEIYVRNYQNMLADPNYTPDEYKGLDALFLLYVEYPVLDIERVERYRVLVGVGEINPVLAVRAVVDKLGQPQVTVTRIYQQHVRPLLVILTHHVEAG
jgi:hypothetical protein